jgi:hypothetical protein
MAKMGTASEIIAARFLDQAEGKTTEKAEKCWRTKLEHCNWVDSDAMNTFRKELEVFNIYTKTK